LKISLNQPDATFLTSASFWSFEIKGLHAIALPGHGSLILSKCFGEYCRGLTGIAVFSAGNRLSH
jgi:hypothetical protein